MEERLSNYCLFVTDNYYRNLLEIMSRFEVFMITALSITEKTRTLLGNQGFSVKDDIYAGDDKVENAIAPNKAFIIYKNSLAARLPSFLPNEILPNEIAFVNIYLVSEDPEEHSKLLEEAEAKGFKILT